MRMTSSPREGWARAPTSSIRSMTACTSASVAVDFITIIMSAGLLRALYEGYERPAVIRRSAQTGPQGHGAHAPAERLAKSPGAIGELVATTAPRGGFD